MIFSRLRARTPDIIGCLVVCVFLNGCSTWRAQQGGVGDALATRHEGSVRVQSPAGTVVLRDPYIDGDTLRGTVRTDRRDAFNRPMPRLSVPAAVAIRDIRSTEVRRFSGKRTALLGVGIVAGAVVAMWIAVAMSGPWFDSAPSCDYYTCAP